jgi:cytochrome c oxidase subunit I
VGVPEFFINMNVGITHAAIALGIFQIPFILNFFLSIKWGKPAASDNPWEATTLEWQTPTPPPHGNFATPPVVYRGPYEYSVPGHATDFTPQNEPEKAV